MSPFEFMNRPPADAVRFLEAKALRAGYSYLDVWREAHAIAFTVAKAVEVGLLADLHQAVVSALREGKSIGQFKAGLTPLLKERGWWGEAADPKDKSKSVTLGSPRRLEVIYNMNMRQARAAGLWERAQRTKATHGYVRYTLGPSRDHRPEHVRWSNLILPLDDPFWASHWPPLGWGCKCWVEVLSNRTARREGVSASPTIELREWVNPRTGELSFVPKGIDPGFEYNPGMVARAQHATIHLRQVLGELPADIGAARSAAATRFFAEDFKRLNEQFVADAATLPGRTRRIVGAIPPALVELVPLSTSALTASAEELIRLDKGASYLNDALFEAEEIWWDVSGQLIMKSKSALLGFVFEEQDGFYVQVGLDLLNVRPGMKLVWRR